MRYSEMLKAEQYSKKHKRRRGWQRIVGSLACIVVFITTYMLILPAITMEQKAYCGHEEHQHGTECFERQLICGYDEAMASPHTHTSSCYTEKRILVCGQEESPGHVHDSGCIQSEQILICTDDTEGHEHTDSCFKAEETYICGQAEADGGHTHGPECYETQSVLSCGLSEGTREHTHSDACYKEVLKCNKEEHIHDLSCYSNPNADVETKDVWERSISEVKLTGVWADDVVAIAESQIGYAESTKNYIVNEDGIMMGYTRYGAWYGNVYGDWCAMFASFCLDYAGVKDYPLEASCGKWIEQLSSEKYNCYFKHGTYEPKSGDLVFFNTDSIDDVDHVGIVAEIIEATDSEPKKLRTIEGNSGDCVQYVTYEMSDPNILGFGSIPENPELSSVKQEFTLTAVTEDGVKVRLTGPESSLPFPADEITITAEIVSNENAAALVDAAVADSDLENGQVYLFDVRLWHDGTEIEPVGPVSLAFDGFVSSEETKRAKVFHVDETNGQATDMNAETTEDGSVVVDTDHFSLYAVMVASEAGGTINIEHSMMAQWDNNTNAITSLIFTASNTSTDNVAYHVEYSDDNGVTWATVEPVSGTVKKGVSVTLDAFSSLSPAPLNRIYRVYGSRDKNNYGYTASVTLYDILDSVKSGFSDWLENSYVQDFGGTALPTTQEELYGAFAVYYALPTLSIETRMDGNTMYVDAKTDGTGTYSYVWEYQDDEGRWSSLCDDTTASINASDIGLLLDGGKDIRCKLYENGQIKATSSTLFVNPLRQVYDNAIAAINAGLNLGSLEINGTQFTDYFYYGNVARDSRVPFEDAQSYADYLAKLYLDTGGGDAGLAAVKSEWDKYLYDVYDPTSKSNTVDYPEYTYGDTDLEWPKDSTSSFHGTLAPIVNDLSYDFLENGVDYSNFVTGLGKTAMAVAAGDANTERKYDIDITADAQAKARGPVAMILQIQTSWQMFDMAHANALTGEGYTQVGAVANNTELATLYDIKQALLRFVDYMETNYPGNNLVLGITEVQHAGSQTMFSGTDEKGKALYVTNNYDILRQSIRNWDSFGNCEHVHYDTKALEAAAENLESNLAGWKDFYGEYIQYNDIQKVAVIIGGPTENSNSTNGYGCTLPWSTFQSAGLNSVYGIRTNNGTSNGSGVISWLDYSKNNTGAAFNDGTGGTFTQKYVATTEDAVFNYLVQIAEQEMTKKGIDVTAEDKYVEDVEVSDIISDEFVLDTSEPITATIYNKDGSVAAQKTVPLDDVDLTISENSDGTTSVSYNFGTIYNTKKCKLHFRVLAKEDYIGSNNVYSNQGTPDLVYTHKKLDAEGNPTGIEDMYPVNCYDTPQVNVPIRFSTVDGDSESILVGEHIDLANLSEAIVQNAEDLVDNYDQINGKLSYTWILPDGTEEDAGSVTVNNGSIGEQMFPSRTYDFTGTEAGQYTGTLKVTFTPETVDSSNRNFSNEDTAVPVNPLTNPGNVWINVVADDSTERFFVRKEWIGDPPEGTESIRFRVLANGETVKDENGNERQYVISAENGWETEVTGLPSVIDGAIQTYIVEEISPPTGYAATYSSQSRVENDYAAKIKLSFYVKDTKDKVTPVITYEYAGETRTYQLPYGKYEKNKEYEFIVEGLSLNENDEPYDCKFVAITAVTISDSNASAEKYLRNSVSTEVKIITNAPAYELPKTGGPGTTFFTFGGISLLAGAFVYICCARRRKRRRIKN